MDVKKKHLLSQICVSAIPAVIIIGLFLFPSLLYHDTPIVPLSFTAIKQTGDADTLYLQGSFDREIPEYEHLWVYAENAGITIELGGQRFQFNERGNTPSIFRSPGSDWFSIPSPGFAAGEPVKFTIHSYYGESDRAARNLLANLQVGDGEGLHDLMLRGIGFFGVVALFAMAAGVVFLMEGAIDVLIGVTVDGVRIALFGFYCLTGGLWCVGDMVYPYSSLIISPPWLVAFLDMLSVLLFPVSLALIMRYYTRGKHTRKVMTAVLLVEILLMLVCLSLQLLGWADLSELQLLMGSIAIPSIGVAMVCVAIELKKYRDNYLLLLFLTVLPVFISNILDGINVLYPFMPRRTLMQYSFALSTLLLVLQLVSYAKAAAIKAETLKRMEQELADSRISVMLSQIQPHFLYNTLQGIKEFCDDSNPAQASEALEHFSYYLRGNLDSLVDTGLVPFEKELTHIEDYLYLEKMRFPQKLNIQMELSVTDFRLPPLTVQPLIENAIRHGIVKKKGGGTLTIKTEYTGSAVIITVADDGVGFDTSQKKEDGRSHIGIENTRSRLETLCGAKLVIESKKGEGTTARIALPQKDVSL